MIPTATRIFVCKEGRARRPAQVQLAFGPVFEALARAESGVAGAQQDVQAELEKLRDAADRARGESASRDHRT